MLRSCIKGEALKLKHSFMWAAFMLMPVIPAIMGTQNYLNNIEILQGGWFSLWTQQTLFYSNFFFAPLIAVYCSYLWRLENVNKNWNMIMTMPVPVNCLFLSKLYSIFKITFLTQLWSFLLFIVSGRMVGLSGFPPLQTLLYCLRGLIGGMVIASLQLLLSMIMKSFAAPVAIAVMGSITGLIAANSVFGIFYPYSLMMLAMNANKSEDVLSGSQPMFFIVSIFYLITVFTAAVGLLKMRDIKG